MGSSCDSVKESRLTMRIWIFFTLTALCLAKQERNDKMFSLFSVVTFKNDACTSNDKISSASTTYRNGTCTTSSECIDRSGSAKGNCAAGFGVCCVQIIKDDSDTDVGYNDTYLQNPEYPSSYGDASTITYKVSKLDSDICFLRLDFELFDVKAQTADALCSAGDHLEISGTGSGLDYPAVCGNLAGSHMYVSIGSDDSDTADLKVLFPDGEEAGVTRKWEIKVAQIPCFSEYSPPEGCLQWFTEPSGTIKDWSGSDKALQDSLDYRICVRQNLGYCCVEYQNNCATPFFAVRTATAALGKNGVGCILVTPANGDWISIEGAGGSCDGSIAGPNKFCEDNFSLEASATADNSVPVCDCTAPFSVGVKTSVLAAGAASPDTGFCLNYRQVKC